MTKIKKRLARGEMCLGAWLSQPSPHSAEAMASLGFDWLAVDLEHMAASPRDAELAFLAAERHGVAPFARLTSADPFLARRLLDLGAHGLIIPVTEDVDAFQAFARHCLYAHAGGRRGVGLSRCNKWGDDFDEYLSDFSPVLIPQIETRKGVEASDALAALPIVDGLFLGPYDLSADLGRRGAFDTPEFRAATAAVRASCARQGKAAGIHQVQPDLGELARHVEEGFRLIAYSTDMIAMRHTLAAAKSFMKRKA
jgi:2-keto-3-deoxy-L-rhamnonate aldolase RhmA